MDKKLLSVGLDVGTTTTQMVLSQLVIQNKGSSFSVPELEIAERQIRYKSPIHFTPLLGKDLVDGDKLRTLVEQEYRAAGIERYQVDTGAIIITGETSRKENARTVLESLSEFAGDFVVATAGPHLESVLAAKGAGADLYSEKTGKTVLHMDIGGGTSNLALIRKGQIVSTGCMNVGGRLVKLDENGIITYRSPVLDGFFPCNMGEKIPPEAMSQLCNTLTSALEMAGGMETSTSLLSSFWTAEAGSPWEPPGDVDTVSFSGGVAECIDKSHSPFEFGDIGPALGQAIRKSKLCQKEYRLGSETIRATVIGAGCHSAQLSGSTVFYRGISFPLKNLPVVSVSAREQDSSELSTLIQQKLELQEETSVLALPGFPAARYDQVTALADSISKVNFPGPVILALQADMAKALGHALALRLPMDKPILCIDRVKLPSNGYLDVGSPVGSALPVVIKTLILEK